MRVSYMSLVIHALRSLVVRSALIKSIHSEPKFCVNCKHCLPSEGYKLYDSRSLEFAKCLANPREIKDDSYLITGVPKPKVIDYQYCSLARQYDGKCGPNGSMYDAFDEAEEGDNQALKEETNDSNVV